MSKTYQHGDRVFTPMGPGEVLYVRMSAPTFAFPAVYSIRLDTARPEQQLDPQAGTIFDANVVKDLPASEVVKDIVKWLREVSTNTERESRIGSMVYHNATMGKTGLIIADEIEQRWGHRE